jgi:uncharacterized repeat protein (TIGR03803 family)
MTLAVSLFLPTRVASRLITCIAVAAMPVFAAAAERVIHSFNGSDGSFPESTLIQATDGRLYGTAPKGGSSNCGTIFRIGRTGIFQVVHHFDCASGSHPYGSLVLASDGHMYGTTVHGGPRGQGVVYRFDVGGRYRMLDAFGNAGIGPQTGLVQASDGRLYGTTPAGGAFGYGTLFRLSASGRIETLLSFDEMQLLGARPATPLMQADDGFLYGGTSGSTAEGGSIYRVSLDGAFSLVRTFNVAVLSEGRAPSGALTQGIDGALYGTTAYGGTFGGGTLYRLSTDGQLTTLYAFSEADGGFYPRGGVLSDDAGRLFGLTSQGSTRALGSFFVRESDGTMNSAHVFTGQPGVGDDPSAGLLRASDGWLYATTRAGGVSDRGTVVRLPN